MKRLKVLISSHEFHPDQGSECAMGWNICLKLAEIHDVTVLCASGSQLRPFAYKQAIHEYLDSNRRGLPGSLHIVFVDQPELTLLYAKINKILFNTSDGVGSRFLFYWGLDAWHRAAYRKVADLPPGSFDIVHQLTPISFIKPGYMWKLGLPFFWGPVGGMYKVPFKFAATLGFKAMIFEIFRTINVMRQLLFSSTLVDVASRSSAIFAVSNDEFKTFKSMTGKIPSLMIDSAPPHITSTIRRYDRSKQLKLCWSGRHVKYKCLPLLLEAIALLDDPSLISLHILGDGAESVAWRKLANDLGLSSIHWYGHLPYQDALAIMGGMDVFVHTSIREAASHVVLEALGLAMPVICHDVCGMAVAVDDSCGLKIPLLTPHKSVQGFLRAITKILEEPDLIAQLSSGAIKRATDLSWEKKVKEISDSYSRCLSN